MCQVTSNSYSDPTAVELTADDFGSGSLRLTSYARPGKIFTASERLFTSNVGSLKEAALRRVVMAVTTLLKSGIDT
jgi:mRNA interferase MazF